MISRTGYEFSRVYIKELSKEKVKEVEDIGELYCGKCGTIESNKWYEEKLINNYLPDYRFVCGNCK